MFLREITSKIAKFEMKNYLVVRIKGKQYKVGEGDEILVDGPTEKEYTPEVLLSVKEGKVVVGKPIIKETKPKLKVLQQEKGEKIFVAKYKAKSRYRRRIGFRSTLTRLQIEKIS